MWTISVIDHGADVLEERSGRREYRERWMGDGWAMDGLVDGSMDGAMDGGREIAVDGRMMMD